MSDLLPIFPLPNVVLFPNVFLPLHIFEPRYRDMIADAIASDRMIGMVLLRPGFERDYEGRPPVFPVGCSGVVTHANAADGRLQHRAAGVERFRILQEDHSRTYRTAVVDALPERLPAADDKGIIRQQRSKLEAMLVRRPTPRAGTKIPTAMNDEDLINALSQYLSLEPLEKQALLEHQTLRARAEALVELLEMKLIMSRTPGLSNVAH
jgi:Lon protease-like protein